MIGSRLSKLMATKRWQHWHKIVRTERFGRRYQYFALTVLSLTTVFWSVIGALLHAYNADQLVDPLLFEDAATFRGAQFPGSHTFLMKWPLFLLIRLGHYHQLFYLATAVGLALITVGALAYILYRIDRRPLYFGTTCLALASVLLLVPAQPYAGALLPVNFAMLTTRNLEYIVYLLCLIGFARTTKLWSRSSLLPIAGLALLIASDKLFLTLSAGGALLMLVAYALGHGWKYVHVGVNWLLGTAVAALLAGATLLIISWLGFTDIVDRTGANPYGILSDPKEGILGMIYAVAALFTNFGANPAFDSLALRQIPGRLLHHLFSLSAISYLLNFIVIGIAGLSIWRLVGRSFGQHNAARPKRDSNNTVSLMLASTTAVALGVFIVAKHYYPVDARYLTISLFTGFIAASVAFRKQRLQPVSLVVFGVFLTFGMLLSLPVVLASSLDSQAVQSDISARNRAVGQALQRHKVSVLVGDYWRVLPVKQHQPATNIQPLASCIQPRNTLTSSEWNHSLQKRSFAYLLSFDKSLTDFPHCDLEQITSVYGQPNSSLLISGSFDHPKEVLLFYDQGLRDTASQAVSDQITAAPIALEELAFGACFNPTVMNIVAHEDDDLLFLSPDLLHSVQSGNCVRTVYLTAGDGGFESYYWTSRQQGSEAAYSAMLGNNEPWVRQIVKLADGRFITIANPQNNPRISLIYINLPDGNLKGDGFANSGNVSLTKLRDSQISTMRTVDGQSSFTGNQLISALATLMHVYQPAEIRTQADSSAAEFTDHSDHVAVKWFSDQARLQYQARQYNNAVTIPTTYYLGYPGREQPPNLSAEDLQQKELAFLVYAKFDGGVCRTKDQCEGTPTYGAYLSRQYKQ